MHASVSRTTAVSKPALVLPAFAACLCLFSVSAPGFGGGLKPYAAAIQFPGSGYAARLLDPGDTMDETGLKPPSAARRFYGQGLLLPQAQDGVLDRLEPMDQGFYYSGSRTGIRHGLHAGEAFYGVQSRLSSTWFSLVQTSITRAAGLAPAYSVSGYLQTTLSAGWELSLGLRYDMRDVADTGGLSYTADSSPVASSGYPPVWPVAQTAANSGINYRLQLSYRYGTRNNSLGLGFSSGRHPDELVARGFPLDDTRQFSLTGNHWLSQDWALNYGIASGEMNRRQALHLGLRYLF
ncbi:MAG: YaiO family outer membrane beta-barrel protein [Pseudomonadota bacterium]